MAVEFRVWNQTVEPQEWDAMQVVATSVFGTAGPNDTIAKAIEEATGRKVDWRWNVDLPLRTTRILQVLGEAETELRRLAYLLKSVSIERPADAIIEVVNKLEEVGNEIAQEK